MAVCWRSGRGSLELQAALGLRLHAEISLCLKQGKGFIRNNAIQGALGSEVQGRVSLQQDDQVSPLLLQRLDGDWLRPLYFPQLGCKDCS